MSADSPKGILREGWASEVGDYAIAGGFSRGGESLIVGDSAGGLYAFNATSGAVLWRADHEGGLMAMAIHPEGGVVATSGQDGCVRMWNSSDGSAKQTLELGKGWVEHLAWSADGTRLAASMSRRVHVFDADGNELWQSEDHPSTVSAVAWSTNEELATACYGRVTFFDATSGGLGQTLEWKGSLVSMVLSPDGDIVACGSQDNTVHFWRRSTGNDSMMSGYPGKPSALAFDDTGTLLATGGGESVLVWSFEGDGPEGTRPGVHKVHVQSITTLAFARRRMRLASGARDGAVLVWGLQSDGTGGPVGAVLVGEVISRLVWRPDGRSLAALDANGGVTVWRVSD